MYSGKVLERDDGGFMPYSEVGVPDDEKLLGRTSGGGGYGAGACCSANDALVLEPATAWGGGGCGGKPACEYSDPPRSIESKPTTTGDPLLGEAHDARAG